MSVTLIKTAQSHCSIVPSKTGRTAQAPYWVFCDSARDGADVVIAAMEAAGLGIGTTLRYGDTRDDYLFCAEMTPNRVPGQAMTWSVVNKYAEASSTEPRTQDGPNGPSNDPLEWYYDISQTMEAVQVPVWRAWNIDAYTGTPTGITRPAGTLGPVQNSAGLVYDPPLTTEAYETVYRISGVLDTYVAGYTEGFANHINQRRVVFSDALCLEYSIFSERFDVYTLKVSSAMASYFRQNGDAYWRYAYEVRYRQRAGDDGSGNPLYLWDGWLEYVLDRGLSRWAGDGADDGLGGTISGTDIEDGMAPVAAIRGPLGDRAVELVLLDGHGAPLADGEDPVNFRYRVNPQKDFSLMPLGIFELDL